MTSSTQTPVYMGVIVINYLSHKSKHMILKSKHKAKYLTSVLKDSPRPSRSPSTNITGGDNRNLRGENAAAMSRKNYR